MLRWIQRCWTSRGHSVHSPLVFHILTRVLDLRNVGYYPEHPQRTLDERLAMHLQHQLGLIDYVKQPINGIPYHNCLIKYDQASNSAELWDAGNILWHIGRYPPSTWQERSAGYLIDYGKGQILIAESRLAKQTFWTKIRLS